MTSLSPASDLHIASLIIQVWPDDIEQVLKFVKTLPGAEYELHPEGHKLITLVEAGSEAELAKIIDSIDQFPGVLSSRLAYHHCEPLKSLQEEMPHGNHPS